ncbi:MAG TPA: Gfo/Idh/MocA family oxidoreductase, partial [Verrucomicrobiota bacterium]|nr:Gfo/Idh/MocA family oxidoreductase [Verrucomicrobiota bacterium]
MKAAPLSRRTFLATAAVAAAALAAEPRRRLRAGFLGTGYSHFRDKHALLGDSPDFELVGLCEEDAAIRAQGPAEARWLTQEELLAKAEVIIVESAVRDHARHARLALEAGRGVELGKTPPPAPREVRAVGGPARRKDRLLQIGYMWRYNPGIQLAIEAAAKGWLGEVFLVRATMNTLLDDARRPEWAEFPGGAMFEQGCHLVDAVVRTLGAPARVTPFLQRRRAPADTLADNTVAVLEHPPALAIVTSAPLQPNAGPQRFFEILGTQGSARVQPLEPPALLRNRPLVPLRII